MATRTRGIFINTVGLLYASLGFSLSVLAALFGIFNHFINPPKARSFHARPHLPRKLRGPRTIRPFSDQSRKVTAPEPPEHLSVEKESTPDAKSLRRRSKSLIPIITIDHFGSANSSDSLDLRFLPKSAPPETSLLNHADKDHTAMASPTLGRPRIKRRCSSPLLLLRVSHDSSSVPSKKDAKPSCFKISRKTPSVADLNQETLTTKLDSLFLRTTKKKSLTLRTQPYGAPYFCTPPLPIPDRSLRTVNPKYDNQR